MKVPQELVEDFKKCHRLHGHPIMFEPKGYSPLTHFPGIFYRFDFSNYTAKEAADTFKKLMHIKKYIMEKYNLNVRIKRCFEKRDTAVKFYDMQIIQQGESWKSVDFYESFEEYHNKAKIAAFDEFLGGQ